MFHLPNMRPPVLLAVVLILQNERSDACLPRREKHLTDSFVPVGIQAVHHYKAQLQNYYPYAFTSLCQTGERDALKPSFLPKADICIAETMARLNIFLIDLQKEALKQNLNDYQGLSRRVLMQMERTSRMTSAQQFHFILQNLDKEKTGSRIMCKIKDFLQDLEDSNSDLFRNFENVKPLNYLG